MERRVQRGCKIANGQGFKENWSVKGRWDWVRNLAEYLSLLGAALRWTLRNRLVPRGGPLFLFLSGPACLHV